MGVEKTERRGARRPTMREVAAVAGVSLSTVSRVINGGDGVRDDLVVKVREAVELLGYRHNLTASTLRRADGQSASIGLIFEDVSNPFFGVGPPRGGGRRAGPPRAHAGGQLRRGARAGGRARRGVRRPRGRRPDRRQRGRRQLVPAARARGRRGAGVRRPAPALPRRRRHRGRQRRRRGERGRAPDRSGSPAHRLPRRPAGRLHGGGAAAGVPGDPRSTWPGKGSGLGPPSAVPRGRRV